MILRGGGDPFLDLADLLGLAVRLKNSGIREVDGGFLIDDSALPRFAEIEPSQPPEAPYNPSIGALSVAFNQVHLAWWGGGRIDAAALPPLNEARFEAASPGGCRRAGSRSRAATSGPWCGALPTAGGAASSPSCRSRIPACMPAICSASLRVRKASRSAPRCVASPRRRIGPGSSCSVPLRYLVQDMLVYSNNMMAELIGLATAQRLGDASGGLDVAGDLLLGHLTRLMPEVDWSGAALGNLSGLDGTARHPRQLAAIARYGWQHDALPALLAGGGWSGTLTRRFCRRGRGAARVGEDRHPQLR